MIRDAAAFLGSILDIQSLCYVADSVVNRRITMDSIIDGIFL